MTQRALTADSFPSFRHRIAAKWAPIVLEPIGGSVERLVIGVAVVSEDGVHVEAANALDRLKCLYGPQGPHVIAIASKALADVQEQLFSANQATLANIQGPFSGIHIGAAREGEGGSLEEIAKNWLAVISSLHDDVRALQLVESRVPVLAQAADAAPNDQIAAQVMEGVIAQRPGLRDYFNPDIRQGRTRRRGKAHQVLIDYSGSKLVANFDVLRFNQLTRSSDSIKRRLWDLKVERDREPSVLVHRRHEMLIQAPAPDDPQLSETQNANVAEALGSLEEQADQEELRLVRLPTTKAISERVLELES